MKLPFYKMNGLGNDFVILDAREHPMRLSAKLAINMADREEGIGCDQIIVLRSSKVADVSMDIYNSKDGLSVGACGNATRCVGWLLMERGGPSKLSIETSAGILWASRGKRDKWINVDMGKPKTRWNEIPLAEQFSDTRGIELQIGPIDNPLLHTPSVVYVGNPHAIFWVEDVNAFDLSRIGSVLEHHPIFPERANISLAHIIDRTHIELRVWERSAGLTRACGTAACAAAVCAVRKDLTERQVRVTLPGGDLMIEWRESDEHIIMSGPTELEFESEFDEQTLLSIKEGNANLEAYRRKRQEHERNS